MLELTEDKPTTTPERPTNMQAIQTRYHGPTNTKGSRYSAAYHGGRIYVPTDHALDSFANHQAAAKILAIKLGWVGEYLSGTMPDETCCHVILIRTVNGKQIVNRDTFRAELPKQAKSAKQPAKP